MSKLPYGSTLWLWQMAGRVGFEPTEAFKPLSISSRAPLATQSSTHICETHICEIG